MALVAIGVIIIETSCGVSNRYGIYSTDTKGWFAFHYDSYESANSIREKIDALSNKVGNIVVDVNFRNSYPFMMG